ncbi:MAG: leucyl/phenylalanyl-tRNA--protein transferase [Leeuwenhoekiella sp.]
MIYLRSDQPFPDPSIASSEGLLAIGGDLSTKRLLDAYSSGIFPWYNGGQPILWWSPDPRMILFPEKVKVSKTMRKVLRDNTFQITYNTCFLDVILKCKRIKREGQNDTWITNDMVAAYVKLHEDGIAQSVEVWQDGVLVGGLYGVNLKDQRVFCGESMFAEVSNASKVALISLSRKLEQENYKFIDCQVYTDHLSSMGALEIPRTEFLDLLR